MSEYFYGSIRIGGPMGREDLPGLVKALNEDSPTDDELKPIMIAQPGDLARYLTPPGYLNFRDSDARAGRFPDLEDYLQSRGIGFDRYSEGYRDWNALHVYYRAGMKEPAVIYCTNNEEEVVFRKEVEKLLKIHNVKKLHRRIRKALGPKFKDLPAIDAKIFKPEAHEGEGRT